MLEMLRTARERSLQLLHESQTRMGRARLGISWYFLNLGLLVGNYVSRLPSIKVARPPFTSLFFSLRYLSFLLYVMSLHLRSYATN